jgi:cytochrome c-type biogenesis protein CcmH/NrfG
MSNDRESMTERITPWAVWVLTIAVVVLLVSSWALYQQVRHMESAFLQEQAQLLEHEQENKVQSCLILAKLGAQDEELRRALCTVEK